MPLSLPPLSLLPRGTATVRRAGTGVERPGRASPHRSSPPRRHWAPLQPAEGPLSPSGEVSGDPACCCSANQPTLPTPRSTACPVCPVPPRMVPLLLRAGCPTGDGCQGGSDPQRPPPPPEEEDPHQLQDLRRRHRCPMPLVEDEPGLPEPQRRQQSRGAPIWPSPCLDTAATPDEGPHQLKSRRSETGERSQAAIVRQLGPT